MRLGAEPDRLPLVGCVTTVKVRGSLLASEAERVIACCVFVFSVIAWLFATGGELEANGRYRLVVLY